MKSFGITDVGKKRSMNQDSIFYTDEPIGAISNLYIVADGMGGHKAGDVASRTAIEAAVEYISESEISNPVSLLKRAIIYANDKVYKLALSNPEDYAGMGTTFVAAVIDDGIMYVANIGDSRLYIVNNEIRQVTLDHSLVEELIRNGQLDRNKGRNHPEKNIITRPSYLSWKPWKKTRHPPLLPPAYLSLRRKFVLSHRKYVGLYEER